MLLLLLLLLFEFDQHDGSRKCTEMGWTSWSFISVCNRTLRTSKCLVMNRSIYIRTAVVEAVVSEYHVIIDFLTFTWTYIMHTHTHALPCAHTHTHTQVRAWVHTHAHTHERSDTKSNVKLGGFRSQLQASYVSGHTEEFW